MSNDSIPLDDIPEYASTRRDQWQRYLVVPPGGGKPVGYTRVTTVAKSLDDGGGLAPWKAAMTASGIIIRRGIRSQWEALIAEYGDPWYAGGDAKRTAKRLVEESAAVGGANDRSEVGTALHTITSMVDLGKTPQHLTEETEHLVQAYIDGLIDAGINIVPGAVELVTVLDSVRVAGTFDRLAVVPGFDLPLIADLKTGANLDFSWNSIAVQLAAYSRGEALYKQGTAKDGSQDERRPMPHVNQDWALVMWLNADAAHLELFLVDINAGWEAFEHSMWAREWRKMKPQRSLLDMTPIETPPDGDLAPALEASAATTTARRRKARERHPASATQPGKDGPPISTPDEWRAASPGPDPSIDAYHDERRAWLQTRIDTIGAHPTARMALANCWPKDIPTLRASDAHTPEQLAVIKHLLDDIEKVHSVSFAPREPGASEAATARVVKLFPDATIINEEGTTA